MIDSEMPSTAEHDYLLYDDENGKRVGLQRVQSQAPEVTERTPRIRLLLQHPNLYIVYEAARVLTAWGGDVGLDTLERSLSPVEFDIVRQGVGRSFDGVVITGGGDASDLRLALYAIEPV